MLTLSQPLILASASPRRAALLTQLGFSFHILASHIAEPLPVAGEDIVQWAIHAAEAKARAVSSALPDEEPALVLGADTAVVLPVAAIPGASFLHGVPAEVLGKPESPEHARAMLQRLSGNTHVVVSAFAVIEHPGGTITTGAAETCVRIRHLSSSEIDWYVESQEPLDKAGGYGIQGLGAVLVAGIEGDYYTVVGLPLTRVWECLMPWLTL